MLTRLIPALTVAVALVAGLTGCGGTPSADPTGSTSAPAPSHSESASPSVAPAVLPADCAEVGTAASRAATVDDMTLQGDGTGFQRPAPAGATLELGCDWIVGDATGILLLISRVDPTAGADLAATLPADGYTCTTGDAGNPVCQKVTPPAADAAYPVDVVSTVLSREDVWIYMETSNIDGDPLLSDLNAQIWSH